MASKATHLHGCPKCLDTFVCACREARTTNPTCIRCIGGHERTTIHFGRLPRQCCTAVTRLARKDEVATYSLAGTRTWWICAECKRAFIYQPKTIEEHQNA